MIRHPLFDPETTTVPTGSSTPPPSGGTPTPPTPPAPPSPPVGGEPTIALSRAEYDRLVAAQTAAKAHEETTRHIANLMKPDGKDPSILAESSRVLMRQNGYSDAEIDAYIRETFNPETPPAEPPKTGGGKKDDAAAALEARLADIEKTQQSQNLASLQADLDNSVRSTLDSVPELQNTYKALVKLNSDPTKGNRDTEYEQQLRDLAIKEVNAETRRLLQIRRAQAGGAWRNEWIGESAIEAGKAIATRWRTLVRNPDRLGPGSESDEEQLFLAQKPIPEPSWKRGKTADNVREEVEKFAVDQLLRASISNNNSPSAV